MERTGFRSPTGPSAVHRTMIDEPIPGADADVTGGDADLVFVGRELLREPYWALKSQQALGQEPAWPTAYGYAVKRRAR
jgi:2,4-dienoyl-CoA reductase-like NADH-dependent reductase (Old Yellow Enzyme family)